jgi:hypothetical protein
MSDIQNSGGCACCGTALDVTGTDKGIEKAVRTRFAAGAEQLGIGGDDLTGLVRLFDAGDCPATRLADAPTPGGCDENCACVCAATPPITPNASATRIALTADGASDIVCTLDGGEDAMARRVAEWGAVVGQASGREPADGGVTLVYDHNSEVAVELARLAAAEFDCCSFFTFTLAVSPQGMRFTVTAPPAAGDVVTAMFGTATPAPVGGGLTAVAR